MVTKKYLALDRLKSFSMLHCLLIHIMAALGLILLGTVRNRLFITRDPRNYDWRWQVTLAAEI